MTMPEMQKAISSLRLLLATIKRKQEDLDGLSRQFQRQLKRAPNYSINGGSPLESTLKILAEIQERLDQVEMTRKHLAAVRVRAEDELQALYLTGKIEEAKAELATLKEGQPAAQVTGDAGREKIRELGLFIQEASARAGEAIANKPGEYDRRGSGDRD